MSDSKLSPPRPTISNTNNNHSDGGHRSVGTGGWSPPPSFSGDAHTTTAATGSTAASAAASNRSLQDHNSATSSSSSPLRHRQVIGLSPKSAAQQKKKKVFQAEHVFVPDLANNNNSMNDMDLARTPDSDARTAIARGYLSHGNLDLEFASDYAEEKHHHHQQSPHRPPMRPTVRRQPGGELLKKKQQQQQQQQHHVEARSLITGHVDQTEDSQRQLHLQVQVESGPTTPPPPASPTSTSRKATGLPPKSPKIKFGGGGGGTSATTTPTTSPLADDKPSAIKPKAASPRKHGGHINWDDTVPTDYELDFPSPPSNNIENRGVQSRDASSRRVSVAPKPHVSRKSILIVDKFKLETRWKWNQLLVGKAFLPYRRMICEMDDLLPDPDELERFRDDDHDDDKDELGLVRSAMLEDLELSEREIAAFFEGFTLFKMKVRSLEAQLNATKMSAAAASPRLLSFRMPAGRSMSNVFGDEDEEPNWQPITTRAMSPSPRDLQKSKSGVRQGIMLSTKGIGPPPLAPGSTAAAIGASPQRKAVRSQPQNLGKSLRMLSIKRAQKSPENNEEVQKLLKDLEEAEKRQKKLEKQLQQAGVVIAEDIPYEEAKSKVGSIAKRMQEIGSSDVAHPDPEEQKKLREEYFRLEQEMEKYNAALMLTDEWIEEQEEMEQKWEDDHVNDNMEALRKIRRHMPVNVRNLSEEALCTTPTPNGRYMPREMAKKFKRTNVLQLLRLNPDDILRMHPSTLENMRVTGLTLTERRAMYAHLKDIGPRWKSMQADKMTERKWVWYTMMKTNFKENLESYLRHVERYGPPGNHPYATRDNPDAGCPFIGKQCPLKADKQIDYDGDLGFTPEAEYEVSVVKKSDVDDPGARAKQEAQELIREKKAGERSETLKKHYKNNVLQVSLANGSCENMDALMDSLEGYQQKWVEESEATPEVTEETRRKEMIGFNEALNELKLAVLQFADRSGMQLTGKKDANAGNPDIRSPVELGLCEEVCQVAVDFFKGIEERMQEIKVKDGRMKSSMEQMRELLDELHERNEATLVKLGCVRPAKSRKHKTRQEMLAELKKKTAAAAPPVEEEAPQVASRDIGGGGGRGGLMSAIAGRGRGGDGEGGGRGDFLSAIAGRGRGRGGGGRGDLMSAIAGRGRGGGGGRGDLLSAIAGRGQGNDVDGGSGGRGDLLSAIAGRGRGGGGGRGDLMSAIAARGRGRGDARGGEGGRGDLMAAIAARGAGAGRGNQCDSGSGQLDGGDAGSSQRDGSSFGDGGRGDSMPARGRGDGWERGGGSGRGSNRGRGSLMAALEAQGQSSSLKPS